MATEDDSQAWKYSEEYQNEAFPIKYRELMIEKLIEKQEFVLAAIHKILQSDIKKGGRMLDFGCGPIIHNTASASRYFDEIVMADYSDYNRIEVEKWLKNDEECYNWKQLLETVAKLEGFNDIQEGTKEIEKRIRSSVKKVIPCNILDDPPIPEEYGKFDLLLTSYCLESVCLTPEMFKNSVKKLSDLIKDGGTLIMPTFLDSSPYMAHKTLYVLPVNEALIKESLEDCNLKLNSWSVIESEEKYDYCQYSGIVAFSAKKL